MELPLFPLGIVLYPRERVPLHIFEPKYKEMIGRCIEEQAPLGVVLFDEGDMASVGCVAEIDKIISRYDDGRMDVLLRGVQRFRIHEIQRESPYIVARVDTLREPEGMPETALKERAITQHMKLLELAGRKVRPSVYQDVTEVSYVMAHNAGLSLRQKQDVLELPGEKERIAYLVDHFQALIPRVEQIEDLRRKIKSNGHFRDFPAEE